MEEDGVTACSLCMCSETRHAVNGRRKPVEMEKCFSRSDEDTCPIYGHISSCGSPSLNPLHKIGWREPVHATPDAGKDADKC